MGKQNILLLVEQVYKSFARGFPPFVKHHPVLQNVSLQIGPGQMVGLVGENGSGKSTLLKIVAGVLAPDAGNIVLEGNLGYCPQEPILFDKLTVNETIRYFGKAYGLPEDELYKRARELSNRLSFGNYSDMQVELLSGGTRQKLNLSIAILHSPSLILLDEPYSGFDYETYLQFWELVAEIIKKGKSILIVSHFINEREKFDRIYKLQEGKCVPL